MISKQEVWEYFEKRFEGYPIIAALTRCFCLGFASEFTMTYPEWLTSVWEADLINRLNEGIPDRVILDQIHHYINDCAVFKTDVRHTNDIKKAWIYVKPSYAVHADADGDEWKFHTHCSTIEEVFGMVGDLATSEQPVQERMDILAIMPTIRGYRSLCCITNQQLILERFSLTPEEYAGGVKENQCVKPVSEAIPTQRTLH